MTTQQQNQEWNFITTETHKQKPNKKNLAKREVLFSLQLALLKEQYPFYLAQKKVYIEYKS